MEDARELQLLQEHEEEAWQELRKFDQSPPGLERKTLYAKWCEAYELLEKTRNRKAAE
jgi:hypothetical protein